MAISDQRQSAIKALPDECTVSFEIDRYFTDHPHVPNRFQAQTE